MFMGDPLLLDNFRPISLLNVDLKILSHVLAQRLKKRLSKLINEDQTGLLTERDTPKIATSGAFTMGVNCVPPMPPRLEIVNPAPCISLGLSLPSQNAKH
jgi:hypothetical protein